ncbi:MAG: type IV secretory system conjugative DNA transfer family protein, partial [Pseudomonadota bacterium]
QDMTTIIVEGIAQSLVPENPNEKPFFRIQAWEVWKAAILHEVSINPDATLMDVYDRLMRGYSEYADDISEARQLYFLALAENQNFDGFISRIGGMLASTDERTLSNILPSATGPTAWLGHENTKRFLGPRHDFNLCDLKGDKPLILNMACPPGELRTTYAGFFRMMMYLTIKVLELCPNNLHRKAPTRIFWDEIQNTGPLPPAAATIWPQLRGFQALAIALPQDIPGLRAVAPDAYKTIMANSAVQMCFQTECDETLKYFCEHHLGQKTKRRKNRKTGHVDEKTIPVMQPDQLRRWLRFTPGRGGNIICARAGKRPLALRIVEYYRDCPVYLYDQDNEFPMPAGHRKGRDFWAKHFAPKAIPAPPAPDVVLKAKTYAKARRRQRRRAA